MLIVTSFALLKISFRNSLGQQSVISGIKLLGETKVNNFDKPHDKAIQSVKVSESDFCPDERT